MAFKKKFLYDVDRAIRKAEERKRNEQKFSQRMAERAAKAVDTQNAIERDKLDTAKREAINTRGQAAIDFLERQRNVQNLKTGHLSLAEFNAMYGTPAATTKGSSGLTKAPSVSDKRNVYKDLAKEYDDMVGLGGAADNPALRDAAGKPLSRDAYIATHLPAREAAYGMTGATPAQTQAQALQAARAAETLQDTKALINLRDNLVTSAVDENGNAVPAGTEGAYQKFSLAGAGYTLPSGGPPEESVTQRGFALSPQENAALSAALAPAPASTPARRPNALQVASGFERDTTLPPVTNAPLPTGSSGVDTGKNEPLWENLNKLKQTKLRRSGLSYKPRKSPYAERKTAPKAVLPPEVEARSRMIERSAIRGNKPVYDVTQEPVVSTSTYNEIKNLRRRPTRNFILGR